MNPAISIIVPVYNLEPYLEKCLDSILAQTFTGFEVIVVNDGSKDSSGVICDKYAKKDSRVKVIHKLYGGVSSARNIGIQEAKGEYIGFVDGDDYIEEKMYETLYQLCQETESDIAICKLGREIDGELINESIDKIYIKELDNQEAMYELFKGNLYRFSLCNKLFKRICFKNICFPDGRIHEDLSTTYKLFSNSCKASYINYIGYIYVKQKNSILTSKYYKERLDAFIGWDEILTFMNKNYPQLANEFIATFTYGCIDNIYAILYQVSGKREKFGYVYVIKKYIRKYYKEIIKNSKLSLKCKLLITIVHFNIRLFFLSHQIKNIIPIREVFNFR
ncbi:glycosyltransferase family 2 protein [Oceanobacillus halophilus]|uniref:Glycosyltransferase n=1 Tax=Oceanobacillus halophilus TaxID=930130 RepID=A0A495A1X7_9BACI|nr:glycosyltransferase [Oceanobacillus halophilus]RKQ33490.1 glycosyltransferase [Oceanobacillus halophilus]